MEIALIAALAENRVIGKDGEMPWHFPEDLQHFKAHTMGSPVIMGRVTYESIIEAVGGPLPDRMTIVLTRSPEKVDTSTPSGDGLDAISATTVHTAGSVEEALALAYTEEAETAYVAGGGSVYEQFLPVADELVLTEIHTVYEGDTKFPEWDDNNWKEVDRDDHEELSFVTYRRKSP